MPGVAAIPLTRLTLPASTLIPPPHPVSLQASSKDGVKAGDLKAAIEKLKTSSMKIGEAMYKNSDGGGGGGGEQKAEYDDVPPKDGDKKKD
jgi:hypothetical protein